MSPTQLNNNLGKKRILEGVEKGIESKQCFLLWNFFSILIKKKMPNNINKGCFWKKKLNSPKFQISFF
jgi:hypothetical protein